MRLLQHSDTGGVSVVQFDDKVVPPYAILSHTWGTNMEEVTFADLTNGNGKDKISDERNQVRAKQARQNYLQYFWTDTCCIDDTNKVELSQAISSMLYWYRISKRYYVCLSDSSSPFPESDEEVTPSLWTSEFQKSRWFARGWTLQELLAPHSVESSSQRVERLKALFKSEYLLPVVSIRKRPIRLRNESRLSEDMFVLGLDTKLQAAKMDFEVLSEAVQGQERRGTYEESIKYGQYAREMRHEEKQGLAYYRPTALERNATKCDEIGANLGLECQHAWIDALCIIQNDRKDSVKQPKLIAQYYRSAVCTLERHFLSIGISRLAKNLRCLVMHSTCDCRVSKSLMMNSEKLGSRRESIAVQDPSHINTRGSPATDVRDSAGAEEQCMIGSTVTCSTTLSDKTSVFSNSSENDSAAGTEISNHHNSSSSTSQSWQEVALFRMGQILSANAHESCESELQNNRLVTPGFEDSQLGADGRDDSGYGEQGLLTLDKDTSHSEEAILANFETSALRDFMDDPGHQYWTWCREHRNWWHKDEKMNAIIWAPLDFD